MVFAAIVIGLSVTTATLAYIVYAVRKNALTQEFSKKPRRKK